MYSQNELEKFFKEVRKTTEQICHPLEIEDYVPQPMDDVSPPKWHLAHTTWFYETFILVRFQKGYAPFHPNYKTIFNSYYKSFGEHWFRPTRGHLSRPTVKDIYQYRSAIDEQMLQLISSLPEKDWETFEKLVILGLNHEQQHQELLLTDIKYIFSTPPLRPTYHEANSIQRLSQSPPAQWVGFKGGVYEIGIQGKAFHYDNEGPVHKTYVDDFQLQSRTVSNGEFLEFIEDQGYQNPNFWLSDAWDVLQKEHWQAPLYWLQRDGEWFEFTLLGPQKLDLNAPVCHVSYYEADAFAQWANKRLPTEAEWEIAVKHLDIAPSPSNFFDARTFHPQFDPNSSGFHQMFGNVWEWTQSAYMAYPGYKRQPGPLGEYNGKFMIDQIVLRGGSCATSLSHIRASYRNFFQPMKRWQFTGFRLAD